MRAESNQIVTGRDPGPYFLLQKLEHESHRHGARTVGNDDQYALIHYTERGRDFGDELLALITRKCSPTSAFAENCHSSFDFTKHLLFRFSTDVDPIHCGPIRLEWRKNRSFRGRSVSGFQAQANVRSGGLAEAMCRNAGGLAIRQCGYETPSPRRCHSEGLLA